MGGGEPSPGVCGGVAPGVVGMDAILTLDFLENLNREEAVRVGCCGECAGAPRVGLEALGGVFVGEA